MKNITGRCLFIFEMDAYDFFLNNPQKSYDIPTGGLKAVNPGSPKGVQTDFAPVLKNLSQWVKLLHVPLSPSFTLILAKKIEPTTFNGVG